MTKWTDEARRAANFLCSTPAYGSTTLLTEDLQSLLLNSGGNLMACGGLYDIVVQPLGAGVSRVSLRRTN